MIEFWKPIEGYEGLYEVSSYGRVRSLDRYVKSKGESYRLQKGKMLSPITNRYGYLQVNLCCNGKRYNKYVHRLVAQAFLQNPENLTEVNHKDEDKTNNRVDNLEWCTAKYNLNYGTRNIRIRETLIKKGPWCGLSEKEKEEHRKEYSRKYYKENKEKILMQKKEYYLKKKEQIQNNV